MSFCFVQPPVISPDHLREDIEEGDTITALLQRAERKETARMEGNAYLMLYQFYFDSLLTQNTSIVTCFKYHSSA